MAHEQTDSRINQPGTFAEQICEQVRAGFGYVPLMGAGLSVTSGIPTAKQYEGYLRRCILQAIEPIAPGDRFIPQSSHWPSLVDEELEARYGPALQQAMRSAGLAPIRFT